ncbi:putative actin cross-linking [Rosa chinensis]|uniref:Putative actin cross-linking n=1 Tax=Rosa chinensis TaxID=74649 RepID=A0A2P6R4E4_ROSCH|nr:uncharacterized protein LOC112196830 [Rosa chinensis]PRQ41284.1 putative actin cross-linking [Rosa chinensis]
MEIFNKYKAVKLRSHLEKYLVADEDQKTVRQSRRGSNSRNARWTVELVENKPHVIRLKSCYGLYLTATDMAFLLGATGEKVLQTEADRLCDWKFEFEPIKDGFQIKFRTWCGKYLRANGGPPPWRNTVTHDDPTTSSTRNWILFDVEGAEVPVSESVTDFLLSQQSSFSSFNSDEIDNGTEYGSPMAVFSPRSPKTSSVFSKRSFFSARSPWNSPKVSSKQLLLQQTNSNKFRIGMELFLNAKAVRLRSHHDKYLLAEEDEESVTQDRNGSSKTAKWTVELVPGSDSVIRLKSCFGKYLTASNQPFLLGMTGRKVLQTLPRRLDSSVEWEPVRDRNQVRLKTRYGNFLRANGGLPPWRNSVTHDVPHRTATQDWVLWEVDIVEIQVQSPAGRPAGPPPLPHSDSLDFESSSPSAASVKSSASFARQESNDSFVESPPKAEGRTIYYHIVEDNGDVADEAVQGYSMIFKGNGVEELTRKLEEETGIEGLVVCARSPLNGQLFPLRLQLPPNNVTMHVVVILSSSKAAQDLEKKGLL